MARKSQKPVQSRKKKNRAEKRSRHLNRNVAKSTPQNVLNVLNAESCVPLDLSDGPISRLPNELVQSILVRFDMQQLIPMQVVCKKWQAVIYSIGHKKKSLFVANLVYSDMYYDKPEDIKEISFGQIDLSTFACIQIKSNSSEHFASKLVELCPAVEQLVVRLQRLPDILLELFPLNQITTLSIMFGKYQIDSDRVAPLLNRINLYTSLKVLDIWARLDLLPTLAPTLARLQHFCQRSFVTSESIFEINDEEVVSSLVGHFGPKCSRVNLQGYAFIDCSQWPTINGQWLANLTHLELAHISGKPDQAIHTLCQHSVSLKVLRLSFLCDYFFDISSLTSEMIGHLCKLQHLTELNLRRFYVDLTNLEEALLHFQLTPLLSIRIFTLEVAGFSGEYDTERSYDDRFTALLSAIIPNVQRLSVKYFY